LTFESTNAFIHKCAESNELYKYVPEVGDKDDAEKRCVLLHIDMRSQITLLKRTDDSLPDKHRVNINQQLGSFVRGKRLLVLGAPAPNCDCDMKGLKRNRNILWTMRFREYHHYRLIGVVAEKDFFVGLTLLPREDIDWDAACQLTLKMYDSIRGSASCVAVKSRDADKAFSNGNSPI